MCVCVYIYIYIFNCPFDMKYNVHVTIYFEGNTNLNDELIQLVIV